MSYTLQKTIKTFFIHCTLYAVSIVIILSIQGLFDPYIIGVINKTFIFMTLAIGYTLINGVTGQLSLGSNGFVAVGGYVMALCLLSETQKIDSFMLEEPSKIVLMLNMPFAPALLLSGFITLMVALLLALPVFRVRGDYLAIVTLGFGYIIKIFVTNMAFLTNGATGLNDIPIHTNMLWSGLLAVFFAIAIVQIIFSKYGRAMKAIRDDEDAAIAMGINTFKIKTTAFCTTAFLQGIGGALLVALLGTVSPDMFDFMLTFLLLIIIVLGGLGSVSGAIIASILVIGGGEALRVLDSISATIGSISFGPYPGLRMVFFSLILLLLMLYARSGIFGDKEMWQVPLFKKFFKKEDKDA